MKVTDSKDEIFVVVDKNDKIIGYRTRGECHSDKSLIHRGVGVIVINDKGEILLQKRSQTKDTYPGYFTVATSGHVNKGESYMQTAKRETFEEIGVKLKLTPTNKFLSNGKQETEIDTLFTAKHNGPFKVNKSEVESVKFVAKTDLKKVKKRLTPFAIQCFEEVGLL